MVLGDEVRYTVLKLYYLSQTDLGMLIDYGNFDYSCFDCISLVSSISSNFLINLNSFY